jgi:hypothetical protein
MLRKVPSSSSSSAANLSGPRAGSPQFAISEGDTFAARFVPDSVPGLVSFNAWLNTTAEAFTLRMRAKMDSAETAQGHPAQLEEGRTKIERATGRIPPTIAESLRSAEFGTEGDVLVSRFSVHGSGEDQKRVLTAIATMSNLQKTGASAHPRR